MDIGCYNISLSRFIFDAEPQRVLGIVEYDPTFEIDRLASGIMEFEGGTSSFTCGTQLVPYQRVNIFGTTGRVEIEIPFNAPPDKPCRLWHQQGETVAEIRCDICDQYTIQGDLFSECVRGETRMEFPLENTVQNMRVIDAVFRSADSGNWETV